MGGLSRQAFVVSRLSALGRARDPGCARAPVVRAGHQ